MRMEPPTSGRSLEGYSVPILLAANYSAQLVSLLKDDDNAVDAVKVSEFYSLSHVALYRSLPAPKPFVLHGLCQDTRFRRCPSLGMAGFRESISIPALREALDLCRPWYISAHLEHYSHVHPPPEEFIDRLASDVRFISDLTGLPVHLENTHCSVTQPGRATNAPYMCDPSFIRRALARTGSKLLLDLAHAQVAAWRRGESALEYIMSLPLELVDEIHVNSPAMVDGELRDKHVEMTEEGYSLLNTILRHSQPKAVSLEYGGLGPTFENRSDKDALLRQLRRLSQMLARRPAF